MDVVINAECAEVPVGSTPLSHQGNYYHHIFSCLLGPIESPPVADLLRRYYGLEGDWLIASPIHWQATHNDAMIVASAHELKLSESESVRFFSALAEFVAAYSIKLHYHDAYTWLLNVDGQPHITAKPVHALLHQSLMPELRTLDSTLFWQRLITEIQMFFSAHPFNKEREEKYSINGIWIWGNGKMHEPSAASCKYADSSVVTAKAGIYSQDGTGVTSAMGSRLRRKDSVFAGRGTRLKRLVCQGDSLFKLAQPLAMEVSQYSPSVLPSKNSLFLFNDLNPHDLHVFETRCQKLEVRWYWNNRAYLTQPKSWISRLIKGL